MRSRHINTHVLKVNFFAFFLLLEVGCSKIESLLNRTVIFDEDIYRQIITPRTGEGVIPSEVQEIIEYFRKENVKSYSISPGLRGNAIFYQRLVDGAIPSLPISNSEVKVWLVHELKETSNEKKILMNNDLFIITTEG